MLAQLVPVLDPIWSILKNHGDSAGIIGTIIASYLKLRDRITVVETKQDEAEKRHDRDLDNIGLLIGTTRAKARLDSTPSP